MVAVTEIAPPDAAGEPVVEATGVALIGGVVEDPEIESKPLAIFDSPQSARPIDVDLRWATRASRLNLEGAVGLTTVLIGRAYLNEVIQPVRKGISVLTAGRIPPNPSELLSSEAMRQLVSQAAEAYDYVLLDTAPLVSVTDTAVLSSLTDGVILVVGAGEVDIDHVGASVAAVEAAKGEVAGIVLNKVKAKDVGYRSHYCTRREGYHSREHDMEIAAAQGDTPEVLDAVAPDREYRRETRSSTDTAVRMQ